MNTGGTLDLGGVTQSIGNASNLMIFAGGTVQNGTLSKSLLYYTGQSGTVSAVLGGLLAGLTKTTTGTLTLSGVNTYRGMTIIEAGTLQLTGGNNRINASSVIQVTDNISDTTNSPPLATGTLDLGGYTQTCTNNSTGNAGAVQIIDGTIQNGTIVDNGSNYYVQTGTVSAVLSGTAGLTKTLDPKYVTNADTNSGTATFIAQNTYTGGTTINGGNMLLTGGDNRLATTGGHHHYQRILGHRRLQSNHLRRCKHTRWRDRRRLDHQIWRRL